MQTDLCLGLALLPTFAVLRTAPSPVVTPQPRRQTTSRGAFSSILATLSSCTTVYSAKVDVPICAGSDGSAYSTSRSRFLWS